MSEPDDASQDNTPDMKALKERYRQEKERRASAGDRRYLDLSQDLSHLLADPYAAPVARDPVDDTVDVLVVGGGFGGLLSAARLKEAGVTSVRIVEVASDVGGTWYWNRYPGAACDIESYIYFPLLEETGYMPIERYSKAPEIRAHTQRIAEHFGLYDNALFSTQVTALDWDAKAAHWVVSTDRGDKTRARFLLSNAWLDKAPGRVIKSIAATAPVRKLAEVVLNRFGVPVSMLSFLTYPVTFDTTQTDAALAGTGIHAPDLDTYINKLWDYWRQHLDPKHQQRRVDQLR